jgi:protein-S-isoprenylcysteine O-methyltransferase Ste14
MGIAVELAAVAVAVVSLATIVAAWRLDFGPNGPTPMRWLSVSAIALSAGCLALLYFTWRQPMQVVTLGLIALTQALSTFGRYRVIRYTRGW